VRLNAKGIHSPVAELSVEEAAENFVAPIAERAA
jgi:hypothetical protein